MEDTIMDDRDRDRLSKSVLNVNHQTLNVIVNQKNIFSREVIDISSDDESSEDDEADAEANVNPPRANITKQTSKPDYIALIKNLLNNNRSQDRVQGGKIKKRRHRTARENAGQNAGGKHQTIGERIASRRHPLQPPEEYRQQQQQQQQRQQQQQQQQQPRVPVVQDRAARSGRGQIPQFESPRLVDGIYTVKSLAMKVMPKPHCPSGYPKQHPNLPCLPFVLQITIIRSLQTALESICYRFVEKWLPKILVANGWDCPDAIELNLWWNAIDACQIPVEAINLPEDRTLAQIFNRVKHIRHHAVHRLPDISIAIIQEMIKDALDISKVFRDDSFVPKLRLWREKLEYFLQIMVASRGDFVTARKLDYMKRLKHDNLSSRNKLLQDIEALRREVLAKEQQVNTLQDEYSDHCMNENELIDNLRNGRPNVQEAGQYPQLLGTFKWLEECFTLNLDRDAPNVRPEQNISGQVIQFQTVGMRRAAPIGGMVGMASGANIGGGGNIGDGNRMNGGSRVDANVNLTTGRHGVWINPDMTSIPGINVKPISGGGANIGNGTSVDGSSRVDTNVNLTTGRNGVWINPDMASIPGLNIIPRSGGFRSGGTADMIAGPHNSVKDAVDDSDYVPRQPHVGQRAVSGPVLRSRNRQPFPAKAVIVDLTEDDDVDSMG
ncbi:hypothetical protein SBOR_7144 [Sclerotinia borealis F-4128]|uniref:Uncharacterized protein n=1 Tax=Sclerotinia borealis (strain F-4128) TaxID=1432307 RepID=W9C9G1_SCLBF|nr:hypothetical protein SBOR_7144 [Sclerotinia borealis F-4128]